MNVNKQHMDVKPYVIICTPRGTNSKCVKNPSVHTTDVEKTTPRTDGWMDRRTYAQTNGQHENINLALPNGGIGITIRMGVHSASLLQ